MEDRHAKIERYIEERMAVKYFLDTYAIIEMIKGNQNYSKYLNAESYTSVLNLYELYFNLLKEFGEEIAGLYFNKYLPIKLDIKDEDIPSGSEFKLKHIKNNISYADALGYVIAARRGLKFLTGDKEFKNLPNVEFAK